MSAEHQQDSSSNSNRHFAMRPIGAYPNYLPPAENARSCGGEIASPPSLYTPPFERHAEKSTRRRQLWSSDSLSSSPPLLPAFSLSPPSIGNGHLFHRAEEVQLMDAASNNRIDCLTRIIKSGEVPVDALDSHHFTALMYAATNGHMNIIRRLIDLGATVDFAQPVNRRDTALHMAAQCGHTRSVELLLKYGHANAHLLNASGKTAFDLARDFGHGSNKVMRRLFEEAGALSMDQGARGNGHRLSKQQQQQQTDCFDSCCSFSPPLNSKYSSSSSSSNSNHHHNNTNRRPQSHQARSGGADDKQHSLLPNTELLKVFAATGIYQPMLSGTGFSLLTPNADLPQMLEYVRISLELPVLTNSVACWQGLYDRLLTIKRHFEADLLLKKHQAYLACVNAQATVGGCGGEQQMKQETLDEEKTAYLRWKCSNLEKLQELLDVVKCVSFELSANAANGGNGAQ